MTNDEFWNGIVELMRKHKLDVPAAGVQEDGVKETTLFYANMMCNESKQPLDRLLRSLAQSHEIEFSLFLLTAYNVHMVFKGRDAFVARVTELIHEARPKLPVEDCTAQAEAMAAQLMRQGVDLSTYNPVLVDLDTPEGKAMGDKMMAEARGEMGKPH